MTERAENRPDMQVAQRAALEWGVLSFEELLACGLSRPEIKSRAAMGHLHRKYRGVYAVGHPKLTLEGCFLAAVKACGPQARLSHFAAGALFEFVEWDWRDPEVTVAARGTRRHNGIRIHYATTLDAADILTFKGIPVTSPARTLVDLASILDYRPLRRAARQALSLGRVTLPELADAVRRLEGRRGTRKLKKVMSSAVPTRSEFEDIVYELIGSGGIASPDVNAPLFIDGRTVVPDFRWPDQRLVVEADSRKWHDNPVARAEDAERRALLEAFGDRVLVVTYAEAAGRPAHTLQRLREAGAPARTTT